MKVVGKAPQWAIDLLIETCEDASRALPGELKWISGSGHYSSGRTFYSKGNSGQQIKIMRKMKNGSWKKSPFRGKILIHSGTDEVDTKLVVLHEAAHWVATRTKSMGHTNHFWKTAFSLYDKHVIIDYAAKRESTYKKKAVEIYEKHFS